MQVEDRLVSLSPGMAVTVEIKTGTRRIISYLLSPVLRYKQEVLPGKMMLSRRTVSTVTLHSDTGGSFSPVGAAVPAAWSNSTAKRRARLW